MLSQGGESPKLSSYQKSQATHQHVSKSLAMAEVQHSIQNSIPSAGNEDTVQLGHGTESCGLVLSNQSLKTDEFNCTLVDKKLIEKVWASTDQFNSIQITQEHLTQANASKVSSKLPQEDPSAAFDQTTHKGNAKESTDKVMLESPVAADDTTIQHDSIRSVIHRFNDDSYLSIRQSTVTPQQSELPAYGSQISLKQSTIAAQQSKLQVEAVSQISQPDVSDLSMQQYSHAIIQERGESRVHEDLTVEVITLTDVSPNPKRQAITVETSSHFNMSNTEKAPSDQCHMRMSQPEGVVYVNLSEDYEAEVERQKSAQGLREYVEVSILDASKEANKERGASNQLVVLNSGNDLGQGYEEDPNESPTQFKDRILVEEIKNELVDAETDSVMAINAKAQLARSQETVVPFQQQESMLTPICQLQSPFDSIHDSAERKGEIVTGFSQQAASDYTEKGDEKLGNHERREHMIREGTLKKESVNGLSSEGSHQNTRSAVDKGNLVQRDTDPSEGEFKNPSNNMDSQQSSHLSHYFNQIEPEEPERVSISKEIILENDEDCDSGVNADILHLQRQQMQQQQQQVETRITSLGQGIDPEMVECSKESTEYMAASSGQLLEASRSNKKLAQAEKFPVATIEAPSSGDILWTATGLTHKNEVQEAFTMLEGTPQFHGSSPAILEAPGEHSVEEDNQQPNYESDVQVTVPNDSLPNNWVNLSSPAFEPSLNQRSEVVVDYQQEAKISQSSEPQPQNAQDQKNFSETDIYQPNTNFELNQTLDILNQNSIYDPNSGTPLGISNTSLPEIQAQAITLKEDMIKIVQEGNDDELKQDECVTSSYDKSRYGKQAQEAELPQSITHRIQDARGSSRFSKGFDDELDQVADRINDSNMFNLNSSMGESCLVQNKDTVKTDSKNLQSSSLFTNPTSQQRHDTNKMQTQQSSQNTIPSQSSVRQNKHKIKEKSSQKQINYCSLPKNTQIIKSSPPFSQRKKSTPKRSHTRRSNNMKLLIKEHEITNSPKKSSTHRSRHNSHRNEPKFPEPVGEARLRYSTPKRETSHNSQIVSEDRKTWKQTRSGSRSRSRGRGGQNQAYPVEIRKNNVIRGPVLREHYDKLATIKNGKLRIKNKVTQKNKKLADAVQNRNKLSEESPVMSSSTGKPTSKQRQPSQHLKTRMKFFHMRKTTKGHIGSERSKEDARTYGSNESFQSKELKTSPQYLPVHKIKKKSARIKSTEDNEGRNKASFKIPKEITNMLKFKKKKAVFDSQAGSKHLGELYMPGRWQTLTSNNSQFNSTRQSKHQAASSYHDNTSFSEINDLSVISGLPQGNYGLVSELPGNKKMMFPANLETINNENYDSHFRMMANSTLQPPKSYNLIQQQQPPQDMSNMHIDQIYKKLSKNWNKDQMMFQQRCQQMLDDSVQEILAQSSTILSNEEARNRKQRYELLKQRLLDKERPGGLGPAQTTVRGTQKKLQQAGDLLAQQQLNMNLQELDQIFTKESQKQPRPRQVGKFHLIFNHPLDKLQLPPSPSSQSNPSKSFNHPVSENHSQIMLSYANENIVDPQIIKDKISGQTRQRSQVLFKKKTGSILDTTFNQKNVMINNITPVSNPSLLDSNTRIDCNPEKRSCFNNKSNSLNATLVSFKSGRLRNMPDLQQLNQEQPRLPITQYMRAATANNPGKKRGYNFTDALSSTSAGFKSSASMAKRKKLGQQKLPQRQFINTCLPGLSPSSTQNTNQQNTGINNIVQKLHYKSMRGRRIKDFLKQVQSQKLNNVVGVVSVNQIKSEVEQYDDVVTPPGNANFPLSLGPPRLASDQALYSQSTINNQMQNEEFYKSSSTMAAYVYQGTKKLRPQWGGNQSESASNNSINQLESYKNCEWLQSGKIGTISGENRSSLEIAKPLALTSGNLTSSALLKSFLAEQDKRIDFATCQLFKKVRDSSKFEAEPSRVEDCKIISIEQLDYLMQSIKQKDAQTLTKPFQLKTHYDCLEMVQHLLTEMGMGYRARRMQRDQGQIDIERVYVMICRAHKLHRARTGLVEIFCGINELEELLPRFRQLVMAKLAAQSTKTRSGASGPVSSGGSVNFADDDQIELESKATHLRKVMSNLVLSISSLIKNFKFFNNSFVFNDKDYLKYLSKEFIELKGLLTACNISF